MALAAYLTRKTDGYDRASRSTTVPFRARLLAPGLPHWLTIRNATQLDPESKDGGGF